MVITLTNNGSKAEVHTLGARVSLLHISGISVLREDDGTNAKRSGIPILGPLVDANTGVWQEVAPTMPQHGTDRITEWDIVGENESSVTLRRTYDGIDHPLIGDATIVFSLDDELTLSIIRTTTHIGDNLVPVGTGFHTYFSPQAQFEGFDIFPIENNKSYHLDGMMEMYMSIDEKKFLITADPVPLETVVWSENVNDHLCVEPWWAHVGDGPIMTPGEIRVESYTIRCIV